MERLKMYILVKGSAPIGLGVNAVGHAALLTYLSFQHVPLVQIWCTPAHFRKVTCVVSDAEFEEALGYPDHAIVEEGDLGAIAIGFIPRKEWPPFFKQLRLFGSHLTNKPEKDSVDI